MYIILSLKKEGNTEKMISFDAWLNQGIFSVYTIVRYLLRNNKQQPFSFWYIYQDDKEEGQMEAMVSGFIRSVMQENPWFSGKVVRIDKQLEEMDCLADILLFEQEGKQMNEVEVSYVFTKGTQERLLNRIEPVAEGGDDGVRR